MIDFLLQCKEVDADLYYPIVSKEVNERLYPGCKRTYVGLREGTFTGGNVFLVNPKIVMQCMDVAERIIENRKNPGSYVIYWAGLSFFAFFFGHCDLRMLNSGLTELLGISGAVVQSPYPELGIDVDKPSDLELVRERFYPGLKFKIATDIHADFPAGS